MEVIELTGAEYVISGDYLRKDFRLQLGELLDQGVSVTLAYGDRDFAANCSFPLPLSSLTSSYTPFTLAPSPHPEKNALTQSRVRRRGAQSGYTLLR